MDGIPTSSLGGPSPLPLLASARSRVRLPQETALVRGQRQAAVDVHISSNGDARSRKVQAQSDRLAQLDPQLVERYQAVIALLDRTNPQATRHFLEFMDTVLSSVETSADEPPRIESTTATSEEITETVSVQVSNFIAQLQERRSVTGQRSLDVNISMRREARPQKKVDPLVLDIDGDGVETSGVEAGVRFDLEAKGNATLMSSVQDDDVLLALDRNGNGVIDNGAELFGVHHGATNGFEELKKFDENQDGNINEQDAVFTHLRGLRRYGAGFETLTLAQLGVRGIATAYQEQSAVLSSGDDLLQRGFFRRANGTLGQAADLGLSIRV